MIRLNYRRAALMSVALPILLHARPTLAHGAGPDEGACCLPNGQCVVMSEQSCTNMGGEFQGVFSSCDGVDCPVPACGNPDAGSCFIGHSTPGCDDEQCCQIVCSLDGICCEHQWEGLCAGMAHKLCVDCPAVTCTPKCLADLSGNGSVGPEDLASLLASWSMQSSPEALNDAANLNLDLLIDVEDLAELLAAWGPCVGNIVDEQEACGASTNEGCTAPAASGSTCCEAHDMAGCDHPECETSVCQNDPSCCETEWDSQCASAANVLCGSWCDPPPEAFETIACSETACGMLAGSQIDFYELILEQPQLVTIILTTETRRPTSSSSTPVLEHCSRIRRGEFVDHVRSVCASGRVRTTLSFSRTCLNLRATAR